MDSDAFEEFPNTTRIQFAGKVNFMGAAMCSEISYINQKACI